MERLSILASGAVAVGLMTSAMVLAQVQQAEPRKAGVLKQAPTDREASPQPAIKKPSPKPQSVVRARVPVVVPGPQTANSTLARRRNMSHQLRPFYRHELMHVRTACGLTKEQLRKIRPEADAAYEAAIDQITSAHQPSHRTPLRSQAHGDVDYHRLIRAEVLAVVERHVTPEQWAAFEADLGLREASRKEPGVDFLVAMLDRELFLTERQRQQISESLSAHWDDRWCETLELALGGNHNQAPRVPDELVTPFLTATQRDTWRSLPKFEGLLWGTAIDHGGDEVLEQELGADPKASRPGVVKKSRPMAPAAKDAVEKGKAG